MVDEFELYDTKWFDYRIYDPDAATVLFLKEWTEATMNYHEDIGSSRHVNILRSFDLKSIDTIRADKKWKFYEKMRRWADARFMRYDDFWQSLYKMILKYNYKMIWVNALAGNKKLLGRVKQTEAERYASKIKTSQSKFFEAENYIGHQVQKDYYSYLLAAVFKKYSDEAIGKIASLQEKGLISADFIVNDWVHNISECLVSELLLQLGVA